MLVSQIAAIRDSVFLVLRVRQVVGGKVELLPAGTAFYVGNGFFVTADHLFAQPPPQPTDIINVVSVANAAQHPATIDHRVPAHDLAILKLVEPVVTMKALKLSAGIEPDGRAVFSYGFINPKIASAPLGPTLVAAPRATASVIGARIPFLGNRYELDSHTYPGESGAPVLRVSDHVVVGVVQASRSVDVPAPMNMTRGPTIASPINVIQAELTARGISLER